MITLTPFERKALTILRDHGPYRNLSAIGRMLFTERTENMKRRPSPQGTALAASRFVKALETRKLARYDFDEGYMIQPAGSTLLAELEAAEAAQAKQQALPDTGEGGDAANSA